MTRTRRRSGADRFETWLDERLTQLREEDSSAEASSAVQRQLTNDVVRRLRLERAHASAANARARFIQRLAWSVVALTAAFALGVLWHRVATTDRGVGHEPAPALQAGIALEDIGAREGIQPLAAEPIGQESVDDYARLAAELGSLSRQLEDLRRLRDSAGPTVELTAQDGLQIVVPLDQVLQLAEAPAGNAGLRRVRW